MCRITHALLQSCAFLSVKSWYSQSDRSCKKKIIANRWQQGPETPTPQHILLAQNEELRG